MAPKESLAVGDVGNELADTPVHNSVNENQLAGHSPTQAFIDIGVALFLVALFVSAVEIPELRLLHLFQSVIYIAVIALSHRGSPWGFVAGFAIAVVWNCLNLFVTHLMQAGTIAFWISLRTANVEQLVPMMVMLGGIGHFILIAACLKACFHQAAASKKWRKFIGGAIAAVSYFALIVSFAQPH